jgi:hypothetical protein
VPFFWHFLTLKASHVRKNERQNEKNIFFFYFVFRFPGKSTSEKTIPPKKCGVRRCLGELGVSEGPKTK